MNECDNMPITLDVYNYPLKKAKYAELYRLNCSFQNKVALVSIICLLTSKYKQQDVNTTCKDVINKLLKVNPTTLDMTEELAEICEGFMSPGFNDYNNYGLKSAKDMRTEILKIMDQELPF